MRYAVLLASLLLLPACKGKQGDKGDSGNANVVSYSGNVTSNDQLIFVSGDPSVYAVSVSMRIGNDNLNLPIFNLNGYNVFFSFRNGVVELFNAMDGGGTGYKIFLIQRNSGFSSASDYVLDK